MNRDLNTLYLLFAFETYLTSTGIIILEFRN